MKMLKLEPTRREALTLAGIAGLAALLAPRMSLADPATVDPRFLVDAAKLDAIEAVVRRWWPEVEVRVTSPGSFREYVLEVDVESRRTAICGLVAEVQRIRYCSEQGLQIPEKIPRMVWCAYNDLVHLGYSDQLFKA